MIPVRALHAPVFALASALALPSLCLAADPALTALARDLGSAFQRKDVAAAMKLAVMPLRNDVYRQPKSLDSRAFSANMKWFANFAQCLGEKPVVQENRNGRKFWVVDCNGNIFHFGQRKGVWRFTAFENANE